MDNNIQNLGVVGVGIDLTDVARIRKLLENYSNSFLERTFTSAEIEYCN
ncbi:MAG: 4'-phosphopantetheinyl transferase superfamily protein, partial [Opitutales bacterium]|nr:4'-phosphopantetheinyl transferase superfamily protein [Opitutales bacterium]